MPSPRLPSLWSLFGSVFGPPARPCLRCSAWLSWLVLIAVLAFAAPRAHAQVFRPRTGKAATAKAGAPGAATALAAKKPATSGATVKPGAKATPARRTVAKKKRTRPRTDDDTVVIDDDDDEPDVKITDD